MGIENSRMSRPSSTALPEVELKIQDQPSRNISEDEQRDYSRFSHQPCLNAITIKGKWDVCLEISSNVSKRGRC